ncbi:hypothetical protein DFS34DRAFT_652068 [Phlyctochytrium arcticum]|nr:hypothetical protein DFS34DRAFT_652068 [Phlyctochytrium arcticum]
MSSDSIDADRIFVLESLRNRIVQVRDSLNDCLQLPNHVPWPVLLGQYNVLVARYQSLLGELRRDSLKQTLVIPHQLPPDRPDFVPNVLLRTKMIPEIEVLREEQKQRALQKQTAETGDINYLDESAVKNAVQSWETRLEEHDGLIQFALETLRDRDIRKELKTRIPPEEGDVDTSRYIEDHAKEHQEQLNKTLMWMSSGPQSWVEWEKRSRAVAYKP